MRLAIEKGSEEFMFWQDIFKFRQQYGVGEDTDEWWEELFQESNNLSKKYKAMPFTKMADAIIVATVKEIEREFKKNRGEL